MLNSAGEAGDLRVRVWDSSVARLACRVLYCHGNSC